MNDLTLAEAVMPEIEENTEINMDDYLMFANFKRLLIRYTTDDKGAQELHLDYGEKEISFDDPALFGFAEGLAQQAQFIASAATRWGKGYEWEEVQPLLALLVEEGILVQAKQAKDETEVSGNAERYCPSPLPPAVSHTPQTWLECEAITKTLTGKSLALGYLEAVVPIYRIAHPALDSEGRQVGEGNVFPKPLRLEIATDWRRCQHVGSRFQDELPMNVTALKTMRKHWSQCMAALLPIRQTYLLHFPQVRAKGWTVGDLQRLSTFVLALPAYLMLQAENAVPNGALHPVLSNLFRITDGVRMTLHYMLFMPVNEPTLVPTAPLTAAQIYAYAERNNLFLSDYGVCAGPQAMIEEFLAVLVDGGQVSDTGTVPLAPEVAAALAALEPCFEYAMLALQVHAIVNSLWPIMIRCYERLHADLANWKGTGTETLDRLRSSISEKVAFFTGRSVFATEAMRANRELVLEDMFNQAGKALSAITPVVTLASLLQPADVADPGTVEVLRSLLRQRLCTSVTAEHSLEQLTGSLMDYFLREQAIVRAATSVQQKINHLLGRSSPVEPFLATDINLYFRMQEGPRRLPYLVDEEITGILGVTVRVTSQDIIFSAA